MISCLTCLSSPHLVGTKWKRSRPFSLLTWNNLLAEDSLSFSSLSNHKPHFLPVTKANLFSFENVSCIPSSLHTTLTLTVSPCVTASSLSLYNLFVQPYLPAVRESCLPGFGRSWGQRTRMGVGAHQASLQCEGLELKETDECVPVDLESWNQLLLTQKTRRQP